MNFNGGDLSQLTFTSGKPWKVWCSHANTLFCRSQIFRISQVNPYLIFESRSLSQAKGEWLQIKTPNSNGQPLVGSSLAYLC